MTVTSIQRYREWGTSNRQNGPRIPRGHLPAPGVRVNHGRADVFVVKKVLNGTNAAARLQQVCGNV